MLSCKNNVFVRKAVSQGYQGYFLNPKKEVKEEVKEEEKKNPFGYSKAFFKRRILSDIAKLSLKEEPFRLLSLQALLSLKKA